MSCGSTLAATCAHCGTELPAEAKFCLNCGHPVGEPSTAPEAGEAPEPAKTLLEQYIPAELLKKLESARGSGGMHGERRVVTMLFCDVEGSTAAAEGLDPEEWAEIMNGAFQYLIAPVYRYEGTLARLMGDAILAFFGAPIAHEDDPQRAILTGLDIAREIEPYREEVKQMGPRLQHPDRHQHRSCRSRRGRLGPSSRVHRSRRCSEPGRPHGADRAARLRSDHGAHP